MERFKSKEGAVGWGICAGVAVAFDLMAEQTMSQYAREKFREHPKAVTALLAFSAFHLTRPDSLEKYDPVSQLGEFIWQVKNG